MKKSEMIERVEVELRRGFKQGGYRLQIETDLCDFSVVIVDAGGAKRSTEVYGKTIDEAIARLGKYLLAEDEQREVKKSMQLSDKTIESLRELIAKQVANSQKEA